MQTVRIHAQDPPGPGMNDCFCTQSSPNSPGAGSTVCFQRTIAELVVSEYSGVYFTSGNELHSGDDWVRSLNIRWIGARLP